MGARERGKRTRTTVFRANHVELTLITRKILNQRLRRAYNPSAEGNPVCLHVCVCVCVSATSLHYICNGHTSAKLSHARSVNVLFSKTILGLLNYYTFFFWLSQLFCFC